MLGFLLLCALAEAASRANADIVRVRSILITMYFDDKGIKYLFFCTLAININC